MFALLRQRNFALLWFGGLISITGDRVLTTALPFYVYAQSHSTMMMAGMVAAELLPGLLFSTVAGMYVDRWDRRRVMVCTSLLQAATVLLLLLIGTVDVLPLLLFVSFVQSTLSIFFGPAENALLPALVGGEQLLAANSLNALNNRLGRLIGPPIGGALLALVGLPGVVVADSATFLAAALLTWLVAVPRRVAPVPAPDAPAEHSSFRREWLDGLGLLRRNRVLAAVFVVLVLISFGGTMFDPLFPAFVQDVLHSGPEGFGLITTAQAVGGIVGSLLVGGLAGRWSAGKLLGWSCTATGLLLLVQFNVPWMPLALALSALIGLPAAITAAAAQTLMQRHVPDNYLGRAFGTLGASISFLSLVSVLGLAGALGEVFGVLAMINVGAVITVGAGLIGVLLLARGRQEAASGVSEESALTAQ